MSLDELAKRPGWEIWVDGKGASYNLSVVWYHPSGLWVNCAGGVFDTLAEAVHHVESL